MYNYGHLHVAFDDGSVGWYEAGWGPMMSETAFFVKDVMSPRGSVSIVMDQGAKSDDLDVHTRTDRIKVHHAALAADGSFAAADEFIVLSDSSKFGRSALAHLCGLDEVDRIVVDAGVPDEWRDIAARHHVELVIAETPSSNGVPNG